MDELIELLYLGKETRNIDYKLTYDWGDPKHKVKITKTIMAMANIRDGGYLILGVKEEKGDFIPVGIQQEHYEKLEVDHILAFVNNYADPFVEIDLYKFEHEGKKFAIIKILEFDRTPIISKNQTEGIKKGVIYIRSRRMPETTHELTTSELRDLLDIATEKLIRQFQQTIQSAGLKIASIESDEENFEKELEEYDDMAPKIAEKILSRGYWRVIIRPIKYDPELIESLGMIREIVKKNTLHLKGWDYPHTNEERLINGQNHVETFEDFSIYKEFWRFNQSGQFLHLFGMHDDWQEEFISLTGQKSKPLDFKRIAIESILTAVTEVFEFASRLTLNGVYKDVHIEITLHNNKDRMLYSWNKRHLSRNYISSIPSIRWKQNISKQDLIGNSSKLALEVALYIYERFNYSTSPEIFKSEQERLLSGRF